MSRVLINSSLGQSIRYRPKDGDWIDIRAVVLYKEQQPVSMHRTDIALQSYPVEIIISKEDVSVVTKEDDFECPDITGKIKVHRVKAILTNFRDTFRLGA